MRPIDDPKYQALDFCPICGNKDYLHVLSDEGEDINVVCAKCGLRSPWADECFTATERWNNLACAAKQAEISSLKAALEKAQKAQEADILSLKNLVRECDEYKIHLSQAQESINYWMAAADEARAQVTIARIQEREACAQVCENGKGE